MEDGEWKARGSKVEDRRSPRRKRRSIRACLFAILYLLSSILVFVPLACSRGDSNTSGAQTVVLYTSVDEPVATPILREFEKSTGIRVDIRTDTEATKSVGLAERLIAEKGNPQADVFWGNELFLTMRLADEGVLAPYDSPTATDVPQQYRDPQRRWTGSALRARVIVASSQWSQKPAKNYPPTKLSDLLDPDLKGKIAIARPTAGTTGSHVAALYAKLGEEKAELFFRALHANGVKLLGGNSVVAQEVGKGTLLAGLTDNDDVDAVIASGGNAQAILPDQQTVQGDTAAFGTLALPCTVALVAGRPENDAAKKLADYLISRQVEQKLIAARFAAYSVRDTAAIKLMKVDFAEVAKVMPRAVQRATAILEGRE
jgi:iron(III) transport system substrate-binding protein